MTDGQGVAESSIETSLTIRLKSHPGVIDERGFRNSCVASAARKLNRQRRRSPLAIFDLRDSFLDVNALVMSLEVVKPNGASGWNLERGRLVRHSLALLISGDYVTKGDPIIEGAHFDDIVRLALRMLERNTCAVAMIEGFGVDAARWVSVVQLVSFDMADLDTLAQVDAVNDDSHLRGFNRRLIPEQHAIAQARSGARLKMKLDVTVGADGNDVA